MAASFVAYGQQSGFQSGDGQTSIYLDDGSAATVNFTATKVAFGYLHRTTNPWFAGFELFGKASNGITSLITNKITVPEGGADFVVGKHFLLSKDPLTPSRVTDDWLLVDAGYGRSYFNLQADPNVAESKRYFDRYRLLADYNAILPVSTVNVLIGIAAGAERRNNLDNLTQVTFQSAVFAVPAGSQTSTVKTAAGYYGDYRQYVAAPIYTDILLLPTTWPDVLGARLGLDFYTRSDIAAFNRYVEPGVGIFLTKKDAPTKVYGGISAGVKNGKGSVALIAGYAFK
jgi:hypothetical protein